MAWSCNYKWSLKKIARPYIKILYYSCHWKPAMFSSPEKPCFAGLRKEALSRLPPRPKKASVTTAKVSWRHRCRLLFAKKRHTMELTKGTERLARIPLIFCADNLLNKWDVTSRRAVLGSPERPPTGLQKVLYIHTERPLEREWIPMGLQKGGNRLQDWRRESYHAL